MQIQNHRLVGVPFVPTENQSGFMKPEGAIMHFTAGFTARSAIATLTNPRSRASAHVVIDIDGSITQLVPFNRKAWHAGPSSLNGRRNCNGWTIGFEFVNPGFFQEKGGAVYDWSGKHRIPQTELNRWDISHRERNPKIGGGEYIWPAYHPAQIEAGLDLLDALVEEYGLTILAGHEEIDTRGWKTDPGPTFPWPAFEDIMRGNRFNDADQSRNDGLEPAVDRYLVDVPSLNVRQGPGVRFKVLDKLRGGQPVVILKDTGDWSRIEFEDGKIGWIADRYLRKA